MDEEEFRALWSVLLGICRTALYIDVVDVRKLIETADKASTLGPFIDPTAYMRGGSKNVDDQAKIARAFLAFRKVIDEVKS